VNKRAAKQGVIVTQERFLASLLSWGCGGGWREMRGNNSRLFLGSSTTTAHDVEARGAAAMSPCQKHPALPAYRAFWCSAQEVIISAWNVDQLQQNFREYSNHNEDRNDPTLGGEKDWRVFMRDALLRKKAIERETKGMLSEQDLEVWLTFWCYLVKINSMSAPSGKAECCFGKRRQDGGTGSTL